MAKNTTHNEHLIFVWMCNYDMANIFANTLSKLTLYGDNKCDLILPPPGGKNSV